MPRGSQKAEPPTVGAKEKRTWTFECSYGQGFRMHNGTSVSSMTELCPCRCGMAGERDPSVQGVKGGSKKEVALITGFTEWVRCSLGNKVGRVF